MFNLLETVTSAIICSHNFMYKNVIPLKLLNFVRKELWNISTFPTQAGGPAVNNHTFCYELWPANSIQKSPDVKWKTSISSKFIKDSKGTSSCLKLGLKHRVTTHLMVKQPIPYNSSGKSNNSYHPLEVNKSSYTPNNQLHKFREGILSEGYGNPI